MNEEVLIMIRNSIYTYGTLPSNARPWKVGLLYVTPDAHFYRQVKNEYVEVKKHVKERKTGQFWEVLYIDQKGRWTSVAAHVVLAELFVEKPNGAKAVKMIDGNYLNLAIDNISWSVGREYLRQKKREEKRQGRLKTLSVDYKKIPGKNAYITIYGRLAKLEKEGDYSLVKPRIQHNKTTDVYYVSIFDYEKKKTINVGLHTLLAETFLADQKKENDSKVFFKDGNGLNISIDNLYWTIKVNPKDPRKDVKERITDVLPVEYKYVEGVFVSPEGRVFIMRDNHYLELTPCDNGRRITVNIPNGYSNGSKNKYMIKKVARLVALAYLPEKKDDEAKEPVFIDGDYRNIAVTNLMRRKLVYLPNSVKEKPYYTPEEEIFSCHYNNLYVSKKANVYVKGDNGYRKISTNKKEKSNGISTYTVSYFDFERKRYESILLKKLMAYAFLKYNGTGFVVNADKNYNNFAIENLYVKPYGSKLVFLDHPAIETYSTIPDNYVNYNDLYLNEDINIYFKNGDVYVKLIRYIKKDKGKQPYIECRFIDENNEPHYFDVGTIFEKLYGRKPFFNQNKKESFRNPNTKRKTKRNKPRKNFFRCEFIERIGDDFVVSACDDNLWLNRNGEVYEYVPERGYHKLKVSIMKKHGHPFAYVDYAKNEKNIYKHKGIGRLLAETFLWNKEGKCPHVIYIDGNYLNYSLDNLALASGEKRQLAVHKNERKTITSPKIVKNVNNTAYSYVQNIADGFVSIPGIIYNGYYINQNGQIYKYDNNKGFREIQHNLSEEGVAYIKIEGVLKPIGLLLAKAFVPNPSKALNWEPINGDARDISLSNIRWKTDCCVVDKIPSSARKTYKDNIWVDIDESVYYLENGIYKKVIKYVTAGKRLIVTICGKKYFLSRLIAEALVYNPYDENAYVTFVNGDSLDVRAANLKWISQKELSQNTIKNLHGHVVLCSRCNQRRVYKGKKYCKKCQKLIESEERLAKEVSLLREIPELTESQAQIINLYAEGKKFSEIGPILGISKQAVHQKLSALKRRAEQLTGKNLSDDGRLSTQKKLKAEIRLKEEIKEKYLKLNTSVSLEEYETIYRLAMTKENSPVIIAKRVIKRIDSNLTGKKSLEDMVEMENQLLLYQRALRKNRND